MVLYCSQCGFGNQQNDKYCGGCGRNLSEIIMSDSQAPQESRKPAATGKYSYDDISELMQENSIKTAPAERKKEINGTEAVSQDMLDSIFDATDDD